MIGRILRALRRRLRAAKALSAARQTSLERLRAAPIRRVLVVCYGNIYRSPFVGEYLRRNLGAAIEVRTRGFHRVAGRASPERHIAMCSSLGIDLAQHRSAVIEPADLAWADIIVLMDRHNWGALDHMGAPESKLVWLGACGAPQIEIQDPYNMDETQARRVVEIMAAAARDLVARLKQTDHVTSEGTVPVTTPTVTNSTTHQ